MWLMLLLALSSAPANAPGPGTGARPRVLVQGTAVTGDIDADTAAALGEKIAFALADRGRFEVLSKDELRQLSTLAAEKQAAGCDDDACLVELAGALDARYVVQPRVSRLGQRVTLSLTVFDAESSKVIGRASVDDDDAAALADHVDALVDDALAEAGLGKKKEPRVAARSGPSALTIAGGVVAGLAGVGAALGIGLAAFTEAQLGNTAGYTTASYRSTQTAGRVALGAGIAVGVVGGVVGGALLALGGAE